MFDKNKTEIIFPAYYSSSDFGKIINQLAQNKREQNDKAFKIAFSQLSDNANTSVAAVYIEPSKMTAFHFHDYYELNYVYEGQCIQYISDRPYFQRTGELLLLPPDMGHSHCSLHNTKMITIMISKQCFYECQNEITVNYPDNFLSYIINNDVYMIFKKSDGTFPHDICMRIYDQCRESSPLNDLSARHFAALLLIMLCRCERYDNLFMDLKSQRYLFFGAESIVQYINENYSDVTLDDLSKKFGYSKTHIHRLIKAHTKQTFSAVLLSNRLKNAQNLLANTQMTIAQVAAETGFGSSEHFCRTFKSHCKITPTQYRLQYKKSNC